MDYAQTYNNTHKSMLLKHSAHY